MVKDIFGKIEAILITADNEITVEELSNFFHLGIDTLLNILHKMKSEYEDNDTSLVLLENSRGWKIEVNSTYYELLNSFYSSTINKRLSNAAFEVLSIIAYRQPISSPGITAIRGVNSDSILKNLVNRGLVMKKEKNDIQTRQEYITTDLFLKSMNINSLAELPDITQYISEKGKNEKK